MAACSFHEEIIKGLYLSQITLYTRHGLQGLQHIHRHNMIHRDIKPANMLMSEDANGRFLQIADLGLAKASEGVIRRTMAMRGSTQGATPIYLCPEGPKAQTPARDLYAFGVSMVQALLHGEQPDDDHAGRQVQAQRALDSLPPNLWLKVVLRRCVDTDDEQRKSVDDFFCACPGAVLEEAPASQVVRLRQKVGLPEHALLRPAPNPFGKLALALAHAQMLRALDTYAPSQICVCAEDVTTSGAKAFFVTTAADIAIRGRL